jgi:acyl-CoA synthetase (AMP-forming)/AMP-acid ligase II
VVFVGRRLGFTKILGHMVDFKEVEDTCRRISGVKAARGTVVQDQGREKLSLSLLVSRDFALSRKDVVDHCRTALSPFKVPEIIRIFKIAYEEVP